MVVEVDSSSDWRLKSLASYYHWTQNEAYSYNKVPKLDKDFVKPHEGLMIYADTLNSVPSIELSDYQYMVVDTDLPYTIMQMYHQYASEKREFIQNMYGTTDEDTDKPYIRSISFRQAGKSTILILICMAMFLGVPLSEGYEFDQGWISFNLDVVKRALTLIKSRLSAMKYFQENFETVPEGFDKKDKKMKFTKNAEKLFRMRRKDDPINSRRQIELFTKNVSPC